MEAYILQAVSTSLPQYLQYSLSEVSITQLHRGTNEVFGVSAPGCTPVIFRKFGSCPLIHRDYEHATFLRVARAGLGPACLGVGPGYRLEEFLSGRQIQRSEVSGLVEVIARQIAKLHSLEHGSGRPKCYSFFTEWSALYLRLSLEYESDLPSERKKLLHELTVSLHEEQSKALALVPKSEGLVFSHNDTAIGNFLKHDSGVHLIDYEYAGLNFPAFDIAMLTNEVVMEYYPNKPESFRINTDHELSKERLNALVETYCCESEMRESEIWQQFYKCKALAHYGCFLWALCQYRPGTESWFDLLRFAETRLLCYRRALEYLP